jgi:hypothetical protein
MNTTSTTQPDAIPRSELVLYDKMCSAIAACVQIDEVASIKGQAEQLEAAYRIVNNAEAERQFAEIKLRAVIKIGKLSRELERAKAGRRPANSSDRSEELTKEQALAQAGIPVSTAHDYEQLTGGKEEQGQIAAASATEVYFAEQREKQEPATMAGLKTAIKTALVQTLGEPPPKPKRAAEPEPDHRFIEFMGPIRNMSERTDFDIEFLASEEWEEFAASDIEACEKVANLISQFIKAVRRRYPQCAAVD